MNGHVVDEKKLNTFITNYIAPYYSSNYKIADEIFKKIKIIQRFRPNKIESKIKYRKKTNSNFKFKKKIKNLKKRF